MPRKKRKQPYKPPVMRGDHGTGTQAAQAIQDAHSRVEMLSSGGPLKERVQASPKPDATIDVQVDAISRRKHLMDPIPRGMAYVVEHVCWHNKPLSDLGPEHVHLGILRRALSAVAEKRRV